MANGNGALGEDLDLAKKLKNNFEAIEKLRERSRELQRLLTVQPITVEEEERLATELASVYRTIKVLHEQRCENWYEKPH